MVKDFHFVAVSEDEDRLRKLKAYIEKVIHLMHSWAEMDKHRLVGYDLKLYNRKSYYYLTGT